MGRNKGCALGQAVGPGVEEMLITQLALQKRRSGITGVVENSQGLPGARET